MSKVIILKGLPASGKTTWAKAQLSNGNYMRISKDVIRNEMMGHWDRKKEKQVLKIRDNLIRFGLELNKNLIIDDTNLNPIHEKNIRKIASEYNAKVELKDDFLKVSPEECIERDLQRDNSVGASVIWGMYEQYVAPDPVTKLDDEWDKKRCIIFDIDGTLAHSKGRNIYDYTKVLNDIPDPFMSLVADAIAEIEEVYTDIIVVSGREDNCRDETEAWLDKNDIPYKALYMRATGDKRNDTVVKEEIYHTYIEPDYAVLGVFDDRPKVCRMWRKLGLRVAQVGNPYVEF